MTDVVLFHHAQGLTDGVRAFADRLREAGHRVTVPDLFEGATFPTVEEGVRHAQTIGFDVVLARGEAAAAELPAETVYAGFSLGVMPAQKLAQTRPGALGALLYSGAVPPSEFGGSWPAGVALQMHLVEHDPWAEEDLPAAEELAAGEGAELFRYPGTGHLVADSSVADYDPVAAEQILQRSVAFLDRVGRP
jgi:dienelactone hydrolase